MILASCQSFSWPENEVAKLAPVMCAAKEPKRAAKAEEIRRGGTMWVTPVSQQDIPAGGAEPLAPAEEGENQGG